MTEVKKAFLNADGRQIGEVQANIDFDTHEKHIALVIRGHVFGENAAALREFIRDVSCFPATKWTLDIGKLHTLSFNGIKALVKLARIVRRRGHKLEIVAANSTILALLFEIGYEKYFSIGSSEKTIPNTRRRKPQIPEAWV